MVDQPPLEPTELVELLTNLSKKGIKTIGKGTNVLSLLHQLLSPTEVADATLTPEMREDIREHTEHGETGGLPAILYDRPAFHSTPHAEEIIKSDQIRTLLEDKPAGGPLGGNVKDADIGFHVGLDSTTAKNRAIPSTLRKHFERILNSPSTTQMEKDDARKRQEDMMANMSSLLLKLSSNLNPARIPDMGSFKSPNRWVNELTTSYYNKDQDLDKFLWNAEEDPLIINYLPQDIRYKIRTNQPLSKSEQEFKDNPERILIDPVFLRSVELKKETIDEPYLKDLVTMIYDHVYDYSRGSDIGTFFQKAPVLKKINPNDPENARKWFNKLNHINKRHGYDSFIYENTGEGPTYTVKNYEGEEFRLHTDSLMLMSQEQVKWATNPNPSPASPKLGKKGGGVIERNPYNYLPKAI